MQVDFNAIYSELFDPAIRMVKPDYVESSSSLSTRSGLAPQRQAAFSKRSVMAPRLNRRLKRKQMAPR